MIARFMFGTFAIFAATTVTMIAHADGDASVSVNKSQFTDKVEASKPVGDTTSLAASPVATYWVDVANAGQATEITLVWKLDGQDVGKQTLDIGRSPSWKTWGSWHTGKAHNVTVVVLDKEGHTLRTDTAEIR